MTPSSSTVLYDQADTVSLAKATEIILMTKNVTAAEVLDAGLINAVVTMSLADGLRLEAFLSGTLRGTEDAVEGPKAFAEKRKPSFQAR